MALTLTRLHGPVSLGNMRFVAYSALFDSSYPAGGEALTPANMGLSEIVFVAIDPINATAGALIYNYDYANQKLLAFFPSGGADATSLAAPSVAVPSGAVTVTSSAAQPNLTETAGIADEVGATTDLSTVTVRLSVFGL